MAACGAGSDASLMIARLFITNLPQNREPPVWVVGGGRGIYGIITNMKRTLLLAVLALAALVHGESNVRFKSIAELEWTITHALAHEERFAVTGQVISIFRTDGIRRLTFTDGTNVATAADMSAASDVRHGDIIAISGTVVRDPKLDKSGIMAEKVKRLGNGPFPATPPIDWKDFTASLCNNQRFSSASGVVTSVTRDALDPTWNWLTLRSGPHSIPVAVTEDEYPLDSLTGLVDAEVLLRGFFCQSFSVFSKRYIAPFGTNGIGIVRKAGDPFAAPHLGDGDPSHRQTVRGVVRAVGDKLVFLQTESSLVKEHNFMSIGLCEPHHGIKPGDLVTVSGFPNLASANRQLVGAVVRVESEADLEGECADDVRIKDLFVSSMGMKKVSQKWHGRLIRVEGTVVTTTGESAVTGVMRLREGDMTIEVQVSEIAEEDYKDIEDGCRVSATGVCIVELDNPDDLSAQPVFRRTLILPRTADDIRVIAHRPWWTPARLVAMIALLSAFLVGAMLWNKTLVERARRQAEALFREMAAHKESEVKVEVRTHLAVELHDSISQSLTGIALQLDSAERANPPESTSVARFLGLARQMLGSCRRELQSCLLDLRNRTFEEKDLSEAIRRTISPLSENAEVSVRFNVPRETLSDTAVHVILKIIRELVVNAIRHGGAKHVRIAGERQGESLRFSVKDDGTGFDPAAAPGPFQGHFGLQGIRERLDDFDGAVDVSSAPGCGAKVTVTMKMTRED